MTSTLRLRLLPLLGSVAAFSLAAPSKAAEELRIGYVAPTTGIFAQVGKDMVDGFQMYLDEVKNDFGGAKVKFIVEDEQAKPDTAVTRAKKLILQDKVHMLVGGLLASSGYALAPVSTADKTVYVVPVSAADDLTQRDLPKYPYMVRTGWSSSQPSHPFGQWACDQGYKKIVAIGADYAFGYEVIGGFQKAFRSSRRSGRRSAPRISGPISRPSGRTPTRSSRSWSGRCRCSSPNSWRPPATRSR
jgi:branched-chain amino acid transport system substrate-binding protein